MFGLIFASLSALSLLCSAQVAEDAMLQMHNSARAELGLLGLLWSTSLQQQAQLSVDLCPSAHGPDSKHENLSWGWPTLTNEGAFQNWYKEKSNYIVSSGSCIPGTVCGHYAQIVASKQVGCGFKKCAQIFGQPAVDAYACHYSTEEVAFNRMAASSPAIVESSDLTTPPSGLPTPLNDSTARPLESSLSLNGFRTSGSALGLNRAVSYTGSLPVAGSSPQIVRTSTINPSNGTRSGDTRVASSKLSTKGPVVTQMESTVKRTPVVMVFHATNRVNNAEGDGSPTIYIPESVQQKDQC